VLEETQYVVFCWRFAGEGLYGRLRYSLRNGSSRPCRLRSVLSLKGMVYPPCHRGRLGLTRWFSHRHIALCGSNAVLSVFESDVAPSSLEANLAWEVIQLDGREHGRRYTRYMAYRTECSRAYLGNAGTVVLR
jgi:hypothetical protein